MDLSTIAVGLSGFIIGSLVQNVRNKNKYIKTLIKQEKVEKTSNTNDRVFRFNDGKKNDARLLQQSTEAESKVAGEVPEYLLDTIVEEIPYILFTLTYNPMEKHWLSRPKGKILIIEDRIDDENHVFDRVRLYVNNKEVELQRYEQIRLVNALISVNGNYHSCEKKE